LIVFVGPPKAGKSTMMLLAALAAHALGKVPLLIGFEMSNEEQEQRIDAITAKISHHRLRGGNAGPTTSASGSSGNFIPGTSMADFMLSNDTMSTTTLTGIESKVEKYEPDILIVDGVYMMQDENGENPGSPQALTNITRGFKRLCQNRSLPTIITTQVLEWKMDKKKGVTAGLGRLLLVLPAGRGRAHRGGEHRRREGQEDQDPARP
jgi:predicted ATP-dependent serine protease